MFAENNAVNEKNYEQIVKNTRKTVNDVLEVRRKK